MSDDKARIEALEAEIERLNKWADGFSDAQLKERQTGEAYQRELRSERDTLAAQNAALREALEQLLRENPAFRSKPIGAPHSPKRIEQESRIAAENAARDALSLPAPEAVKRIEAMRAVVEAAREWREARTALLASPDPAFAGVLISKFGRAEDKLVAALDKEPQQ